MYEIEHGTDQSRYEHSQQAQRERYQWALKVDPEAVKAYHENVDRQLRKDYWTSPKD